MANDEQQGSQQDSGKQRAKASTPEPRFGRDRAIAAGEALTGHPSHVVAGALHGSDPDDTFTKAELERKVRAFLGREVQEG